MTKLRLREPTGLAAWPVVLVEGEEKSGKSWAAAEFTADKRIGDVFWFDIGEGAADEYASIPGAKYSVVVHNGTFKDIIFQLLEACKIPKNADGKPNVIIIDNASSIWNILCDNAQETAEARNSRSKYPKTDDEVSISMDLWNAAKRHWRKFMDALMSYQGIVIVIARGKEVVETDDNGRPTKRSTWKVEGEKSIAYDVDAWVRLTRHEPPKIVGIRSVKRGVRPGVQPPKLMREFSISKLIFDVMGVRPAAPGREYQALTPTEFEDDQKAAPTTKKTSKKQKPKQTQKPVDYSNDPKWTGARDRLKSLIEANGVPAYKKDFLIALKRRDKVSAFQAIPTPRLVSFVEHLEAAATKDGDIVRAMWSTIEKYHPEAIAELTPPGPEGSKGDS